MAEFKSNYKSIFGIFLIFFSILILISMLSYLFTWQIDQSELDIITKSNQNIQNYGKKIGLIISNFLIFKGFGLGSFVFPILFGIYGLSLLFNIISKKLIDISINALVICIWTSLTLSYVIENKIYGGVFGYEIHIFLIEYIGDIGLILSLVFILLCFLILNFNINNTNIQKILFKSESNKEPKIDQNKEKIFSNDSFNKNINLDEEIKPTISKFSKLEDDEDKKDVKEEKKVDIEIEKTHEEEIADLNNLPDYDQKLDLGSFIKPKIDLLVEHDNTGAIKIDEVELGKNKDKIEETLLNYKIEIEKIFQRIKEYL